MGRESGFYRVKEDGEWTVAQYHSQWDKWYSIGEGAPSKDADFEEIDEARIEMPSETPAVESNFDPEPSFP